MEVQDPIPQPLHGTVGVDLGIKSLATTSDGTTFNNPKTLARYEKRLARLQRQLFRRKKGSNNRNKTKVKLAKLHRRITNVRGHTLHQVSAHIIHTMQPEKVVLEDLAVGNMVQNHHLAKALHDAAMSKLRRQVEYKAAWAGVEVVIADRFFPSTKRCSQCGHIKEEISLHERTYKCDECGLTIDRDLNAALNLAHYVP